MIIEGIEGIKGAECESHNDHRIAMMIAVAGTVAKGTTSINNPECASISFPNFYDKLNNFRK